MTDTDKKLRLLRFLREENMRNRISLQNREEILYGTVPSWEEHTYISESAPLYEASFCPEKGKSLKSGLKTRACLAIALFVLALYADISGKTVGQRQTADWICKQLDWSVEAKLIDFISDFPYTLSDKP